MIKTIVFLVIALILYGYSFLRYRYLWSRGKMPMFCYYVFQALLLGTLFVCFFFSNQIENDYLLLGIQLICNLHMAVMFFTPFFSLIRGAIRMLGKRLQWKNRMFRFFDHPSKVSKIVLVLTLMLGLGIFIQSKIPRFCEDTIRIEKQAKVNSLLIATVSDLQIGSCMTQYEVKNFFLKLEQSQPDYVVFMGNFYSYPVNSSLREYTNQLLKKLVSVIPVYMIEGPNEAMGKVEYLDDIRALGVKVLQDEMIQLSDGIQLVGCRYRENEKRRKFAFTCSLLDKNKPAIVLSYEDLSEEEKQSTDYDVLLRATPYAGSWSVPKQIQLTRLQFMPKEKELHQ